MGKLQNVKNIRYVKIKRLKLRKEHINWKCCRYKKKGSKRVQRKIK